MQIILVNKEDYKKEFIEYLCKSFIPKSLMHGVITNRLKLFSDMFNLDMQESFRFMLSNIEYTEDSSNYIIRFNRIKKFKGHTASNIANIITYGNLSVKGYSIINDIFNYVSSHVDDLKLAWESLNGH